MLWRREDTFIRDAGVRPGVIVAGPGSSLTIPGIIVSELAQALYRANKDVTRVEVDVATDFMAGIHRAQSLAAAFEAQENSAITSLRAPDKERPRNDMFRSLFHRGIGTAIAYTWPGLDNDWIPQFLRIANSAGATTIVVCASLPEPNSTKVASLAETIYHADHVYVGDVLDAMQLRSIFRSHGPIIDVDPALSLRGRVGRTTDRQITAFLPKDNRDALATVLAAFDAIPEAWIDDFKMRVIMRYSSDEMPEMIAESYHADHVSLLGEDMSSSDLDELCSTSSALGIANPIAGSRAFSSAVDSGIATVVLNGATRLGVGRGYVGGLVADLSEPASIHVALNHALRLEALRFPSPDAFDMLARRLVPATPDIRQYELLEPLALKAPVVSEPSAL